MIIAFSGKRGSGKDTVVAMLRHLDANAWEIRRFAAKLKLITAVLTGLPEEDMYTVEGKAKFIEEFGMSVGLIQQKVGTDLFRNHFHPDTWVLATLTGLAAEDNVLITDCRFPNEMEAVRARGGVVVRIEGDPEKVRGDGSRDDDHISETALDEAHFDVLIRNDGSLRELEAKVGALVDLLPHLQEITLPETVVL